MAQWEKFRMMYSYPYKTKKPGKNRPTKNLPVSPTKTPSSVPSRTSSVTIKSPSSSPSQKHIVSPPSKVEYQHPISQSNSDEGSHQSSPSPTTSPVTTNVSSSNVHSFHEDMNRLAHDNTADIVALIFILFAIIGMLFTAWQVLENPNGCCASLCRSSLHLIVCFCAIFFRPCTLWCRKRQGYNVASQSSIHRPMDNAEFEHSLELT